MCYSLSCAPSSQCDRPSETRISTSKTETNSTIVSKFLSAQKRQASALAHSRPRRNGSGASECSFDSLEEEGQILVDDPADDDERRDEAHSDLHTYALVQSPWQLAAARRNPSGRTWMEEPIATPMVSSIFPLAAIQTLQGPKSDLVRISSK